MQLKNSVVGTLVILAGLLSAAVPATGQIVGNTLSLTDGSAPAGQTATVTLSYANEFALGGIQADVLFNPDVAAFADVTVTGQAMDMTVEGRVVESGRLRVVMFFGDSGYLLPGEGNLAELVFFLQGAAGGETSLTLGNLVFSDPSGAEQTVVGEGGNLTVLPPEDPPTLSIAVLKNPGRTHTVRIFVTLVGGSGDAPTVTANGEAVTMALLETGVFTGQHYADDTETALTVTAVDTNSHGTGNAQAILALP